MENFKTQGTDRSRNVNKENLRRITRREMIGRCIQWVAAGGLFTMMFQFIRGMRTADLEVLFERKPRVNEVVFNCGVYLVGLEQGIKAFSDRCPHLGCRLLYNKKDACFQCPCHGSRFSRNGSCIQGPARKNMALLELRTDDKCGSYTARLPIF